LWGTSAAQRWNRDGKKALMVGIKDGPSGESPMTFKVEILLIAAAVAASLVLAHLLEGARLAAVIQ
jgi:hypothetical protein